MVVEAILTEEDVRASNCFSTTDDSVVVETFGRSRLSSLRTSVRTAHYLRDRCDQRLSVRVVVRSPKCVVYFNSSYSTVEAIAVLTNEEIVTLSFPTSSGERRVLILLSSQTRLDATSRKCCLQKVGELPHSCVLIVSCWPPIRISWSVSWVDHYFR